MDCSLAEAPAYIERVLRTFPREDVQKLVDRVAKWNAEPAKKAAEAAFAEVLDSAKPDKAGGVEQIAGGILTALGLSSVFLRDAMTKVKVFIEAEEIKQKIK